MRWIGRHEWRDYTRAIWSVGVPGRFTDFLSAVTVDCAIAPHNGACRESNNRQSRFNRSWFRFVMPIEDTDEHRCDSNTRYARSYGPRRVPTLFFSTSCLLKTPQRAYAWLMLTPDVASTLGYCPSLPSTVRWHPRLSHIIYWNLPSPPPACDYLPNQMLQFA